MYHFNHLDLLLKKLYPQPLFVEYDRKKSITRSWFPKTSQCSTPQKLGKDETPNPFDQQQFCVWIIINTDAPTTVYQVPSLWWLVLFKTQWTLCNRRIRWRISGFPGWKKKLLVGSKWWSKFTFPRNPCDLKHCNMYITDIFRMIPQMDHHDHFRMTIQLSHFLAAPQGEGVRGDVEQWGDGRSTVWSWCWSLDLWKITSRIEDPWRSFNLEGNVFMFVDVHLLQWWVMWYCMYWMYRS